MCVGDKDRMRHQTRFVFFGRFWTLSGPPPPGAGGGPGRAKFSMRSMPPGRPAGRGAVGHGSSSGGGSARPTWGGGVSHSACSSAPHAHGQRVRTRAHSQGASAYAPGHPVVRGPNPGGLRARSRGSVHVFSVGACCWTALCSGLQSMQCGNSTDSPDSSDEDLFVLSRVALDDPHFTRGGLPEPDSDDDDIFAAPKQKPAARKPAARKPAARKPAAHKPAARKPAARKPAARKPAARKRAASKEGDGRSTAKRKKRTSTSPTAKPCGAGTRAQIEATWTSIAGVCAVRNDTFRPYETAKPSPRKPKQAIPKEPKISYPMHRPSADKRWQAKCEYDALVAAKKIRPGSGRLKPGLTNSPLKRLTVKYGYSRQGFLKMIKRLEASGTAAEGHRSGRPPLFSNNAAAVNALEAFAKKERYEFSFRDAEEALQKEGLPGSKDTVKRYTDDCWISRSKKVVACLSAEHRACRLMWASINGNNRFLNWVDVDRQCPWCVLGLQSRTTRAHVAYEN
eukprot:SAG31_NODE_791_length_12069_cov_22.664411_6_plen_510_part_00